LEREFWKFVEADQPPPNHPALPAVPKPEEWRVVDFAGSNSWAAAAADWLAHRDSAKAFDKA
jgi:hypothetical protein